MARRSRKSRGVTLDRAISIFLQSRKVKNLSGETVKWYRKHLDIFKSSGVPQNITHIEAYHIRDFIGEQYDLKISENTVQGRYRALNAFFNYIYREGIIEHNPMLAIDKPKVGQVLIMPFSNQDIKRFFAVIDRTTFVGIRDYALFFLLLDTGLRISEAINITKHNLFLDAQHIYVNSKGNKERMVPFGRKTLCHLKEYLQELDQFNYIFLNEYDGVIKYRTCDNNCKKYGELAGIEGKRVSCHTFRHTFAVNFLKNGGDTRSLQKILGHSSLKMVEQYTNILDEDIKQIYQKNSPGDRLF